MLPVSMMARKTSIWRRFMDGEPSLVDVEVPHDVRGTPEDTNSSRGRPAPLSAYLIGVLVNEEIDLRREGEG
jgi:hypothetical protein